MTEQEAPFTLEQLTRLLKASSDDLVLVGGQALAFWVDYYGVKFDLADFSGAISRDTDFLGKHKNVAEIAKGVNGTPIYPHERELTALAGQVRIHLNKKEFLNVDIIHKVYGLKAAAIRRHALKGTLEDATFWVMHPLDVLHSRIKNLTGLKNKQTPECVAQTKLALKVANCHIASLAQDQPDEKLALKAIEHIAKIARSGAGRKAVREYGIDFFSALPLDRIRNERFRKIRREQIIAELTNAN